MIELKTELPVMATIESIQDEARDIRSFRLAIRLRSRPGQFVMMWIPGSEERPFSIGFEDDRGIELTIAKVGKTTEQVFRLRPGDKVGIRGPYGKPFETGLAGKNIGLVGGGYGAAPLSYLASALSSANKIFFFAGARTEDLLLYRSRLAREPYTTYYSTDDGSFGEKGFITEILKKEIPRQKISYLYTVGPELMMKRVVGISDEFGIPCQISLERIMKCGFGICGSCVVDPTGERMCVEGPCISKEQAKKIDEFGVYHRDKLGRKVSFR